MPEVTGGERWVKPTGLGGRGWAILLGVITLLNLPLLHYFVLHRPPKTVVQAPYEDVFSDEEALKARYWTTGGHWRLIDGELHSPGVRNNPLWLRLGLPDDVRIELEARSESSEGDIKFEVYGDGVNHQSGYVVILGGWNNRISIIARLDEHGDALRPGMALGPKSRVRVENTTFRVERGRVYKLRFERRGTRLALYVDGELLLELDDPYPLKGRGHDRFGFSSWDTPLYFDNLRINAL